MRILFDGIPVEVTKKSIKSFNLRVHREDARVTLSAPRRASHEEIEDFLRAHGEWLKQHVAAARQRAAREGKNVRHRYDTGETLLVWGQPRVLLFSPLARGTLRDARFSLDGTYLRFALPARCSAEERGAFLKEALRAELLRRAGEIAPELETLTGLHALEWRTKEMRTRWGTCNVVKKRIWLSLALVQHPPICLRYIILHELLHLTEPSHNRRFHALMSRYMPEWREVKKLLNA